ncbi:MAG: DsbA family protein [Parvibaculaceae bacterium]
MNQNRVIAIVVAAVLAFLALGYFGYSTFAAKNPNEAAGDADRSKIEKELAIPGPMGDMSLGDPKAPVRVYEYASLTCSHCAEFNKDTFPAFKKDYIDTGKVYYTLRDFPFDPIATAAYMLAHCSGKDRYFGFVDVLFSTQNDWAFVETPMEALKRIAKQGGFSDETFDACMKNEAVFDHVKKTAERGAQTFGVRSTPTFFINGEKVEGAIPYAEFEPIIKKHLPGYVATDANAAAAKAEAPAGESTPAAPQ